MTPNHRLVRITVLIHDAESGKELGQHSQPLWVRTDLLSGPVSRLIDQAQNLYSQAVGTIASWAYRFAFSEDPVKFPGTPCHLCKGDSATWTGTGDERRLMTSVEWCREMDTCAATIDWEKIHGDR
jgi:hypothetical protein